MPELTILDWAHFDGVVKTTDDDPGYSMLRVPMDELPVPMKHSVAKGRPLVSNGELGVDLIQVAAGNGFVPHVHPGHHILIVVAGYGTITYGGSVYPTHAGQVYFMDASVPHAVGAITDHMILAPGAPHKPVDSEERMEPVGYDLVTDTSDGEMTCRVCGARATFPTMLHQVGCAHCPAVCCITTGDDELDAKLRTDLERKRSLASTA